MRYLLGFACVLALAVTGCSETSCPECGGDGGAAGIGGAGGTVADCSSAEREEDCIVDGNAGVCFGDICVAVDCSGLERGTRCATYEFGEGACETHEGETACFAGVTDCAGIEDDTRCVFASNTRPVDWYGSFCTDETCYANSDCDGAALGDACWIPAGMLLDYPGVCSAEVGCTDQCEFLEDGDACRNAFDGPTGVCEGDTCVVE